MKSVFFRNNGHIFTGILSPHRPFLIFIIVMFSLTMFVLYNSQLTSSQNIIPTSPVEGNDSLIMQGKSKIIPWSGWWWPFYVKSHPNLYNPKGPMDKYDQVSIARGQLNPGAMDWERQNHYTDKKEEAWFGHCNGWAAAAVLEPQPEDDKVISGVKFEVNDLMGLLSEWHWWDSATAFYGTRYKDERDDINDVYPHEFHYALMYYIGERGLPLIMDISGGTKEKDSPQVWNFPAFQYEFEYRPDRTNSEQTHVHCRLWFSDYTPPDSLKNKTFVKDYFYWIKGEKRHPTSGGWETAKDGGWGSKGDSRASHPDFLWYPAKAKQHSILDSKQFSDIVGQGENR